MQSAEKHPLSEESQCFTEASHWLQKALLEADSSELISLCCMQGLDPNAQILGSQEHFCPLQYLNSNTGEGKGRAHRQ